MRIDGIQLTQGSSISNLVVASGTLSFPSNPDEGELFFRTDSSETIRGLYVYVNGNWDRIGSADSLTVPNGTSLPSAALAGDLYYKNTNDSSKGLYVYTGSAWTSINAGSVSFTISGDITGTIDGGTDALTLNTVNSAPGTYGSGSNAVIVAVNAKGLVTSASTTPIAINASQVTAGTFADGRIAQSNVTQHQAALAVASTQVSDFDSAVQDVLGFKNLDTFGSLSTSGSASTAWTAAMTTLSSSGGIINPKGSALDLSSVSIPNGITVLDVAGNRIISSNVGIGKSLQASGGHLLIRNARGTQATRVHIEPNGYVVGTASKLDLMLDPYDDTGNLGYRILNFFTKTYDPADAATTTGSNGIGVIGMKGVTNQFGVFPTMQFGFSDGAAGSATPLHLHYFDYSDSAWRTPMLGGWRTGMAVTAGDYCLGSYHLYQAATSGTTGSTLPSHSSGDASDGGVTWTFIRDFQAVSSHFRGVVMIGDRDDMPKFGLPTSRAQFSQDIAMWNGKKFRFLNGSSASAWSVYTNGGTDDLYIETEDGGKRIRLDATGQFMQLANLVIASTGNSDTSGTSTPSIKGIRLLTFGNTSATTITSFIDGISNQEFYVRASNGQTTIQHNANIRLLGGIDHTLSTDMVLHFVMNTAGTVATQVLSDRNATTLAGYGITDAQPLDGDLTAIANISGTSGFLKKTAANTWELDTAGYLTSNQTITLSGDVSGSGSSAITTTLASVGTAGTYGSASNIPVFTTDAKGRITSVTNTSVSIAESQIVDGSILARNAGNETISGTWTFNNAVTGVDPTSASHLATKNYVDNALVGLSWKRPVRVATTANITLSGTQTIDGIAVVAGDRVLVKDQTTASQNGVYVVASGSWARATDFDQVTPIDEVNSAAVFVTLGSTNSDTGWTQTATVSTVGTDAMTFVQFSAAGALTAGSGLVQFGNAFNIGTVSSSRIVVNADNIDLATVTDSGTGSLKKISTDSYGRVTGTANIVAADITALVDTSYVNVSGDTMTGDLAISESANASANITVTNTSTGTAANSRVVLSNGTDSCGLIMQGTGNALASQGTMYVTGANPLTFSTNGAERMRITSSGFVGIGKTPIEAFEVLNTNGRAHIHMETTKSGETAAIKLTATAGSAEWTMAAGTGSTNNLAFSSTSGGEMMRLTTTGALIGATTATSVAGNAKILHIESAGTSAGISVIKNTADTLQPVISLGKSRGTSSGAVTIVQSGDALGSIKFSGADGVNLNSVAAEIQAAAEGTVGASIMPGRLVFSTTAAGANTVTERMRIDSVGVVLIGTNSQRVLSTAAPMRLQVEANDSNAGVSITRNTNDGVGPNYRFYKTRGTSLGSNTAVASGDYLGHLQWYGADGTNPIVAGEIRCEVDNTPGTSDMPGRLTFSTTSDGASSVTERMRIDSVGNVGIGTTTLTSKLNVAGSVNITSSGAVTVNGSSSGSAVFRTTSSTGGASILSVTPSSTTAYTDFDFSPTTQTTDSGILRVFRNSDVSASNSHLAIYAPNTSTRRIGLFADGNITSLGDVNNIISVTASNINAGTGADARFTVSNGITAGGWILRGTGFTNVAGEANALAAYVTGANPMLFYINGTEKARFTSTGSFTITGSGGLGYGTGSGGTVTQATSRTTGVTLNKTNGAITLVSAAGSSTWQSFTVTNSTVAATDVVIVNQKSGTDKYMTFVTNVSAGSFVITFATTGGTTTEQPVFNFAVIKAVTA
jgi:hypothetical protein